MPAMGSSSHDAWARFAVVAAKVGRVSRNVASREFAKRTVS